MEEGCAVQDAKPELCQRQTAGEKMFQEASWTGPVLSMLAAASRKSGAALQCDCIEAKTDCPVSGMQLPAARQAGELLCACIVSTICTDQRGKL